MTAILHTPDGSVIPVYRSLKGIEWAQHWDTALPSWLASSGTLALSDIATSRGTARVTTGTVSGNEAKVETTANVNLGQYHRVAITFESLAFDSTSNYEWSLDMFGAAGGARLFQASTSTKASVRLVTSGGANVDTEIEYRGRSLARRNLTLAVYPQEKAWEVSQDGSVIAYKRDATNWASTSVKPAVRVITRNAAAHWAEFSKVRLDLITS